MLPLRGGILRPGAHLGPAAAILYAPGLYKRRKCGYNRKQTCVDEECLNRAPQSEPEFGESPEVGGYGESPRSSEPKAQAIRLRRVARYSERQVGAVNRVNLGGTAKRLRPKG